VDVVERIRAVETSEDEETAVGEHGGLVGAYAGRSAGDGTRFPL